MNFYGTVSGHWPRLRDNVPIKFLMAGTTFYLLTCFQGPMHSLRTVNAIVSKTDWIVGHAHMAVLGAFTSSPSAAPIIRSRAAGRRPLHSEALADHIFWLFLTGGLAFFAALWIGGFFRASVERHVDPVHRHREFHVPLLGGAPGGRHADVRRDPSVLLEHGRHLQLPSPATGGMTRARTC